MWRVYILDSSGDVSCMATTNLNIRIDSELNSKAQAVFEPMGIDISDVVNALLHNILFLHEIPLDSLRLAPIEKKNRRAAFGCLKGKIHVPDDFNEPLPDFADYM